MKTFDEVCGDENCCPKKKTNFMNTHETEKENKIECCEKCYRKFANTQITICNDLNCKCHQPFVAKGEEEGLKICKRCKRSEKLDFQIPQNCFDSKGNYHENHAFEIEKVCSCGHGETSHGFINGVIQCSVGDCFNYRNYSKDEHIFSTTPPKENIEQGWEEEFIIKWGKGDFYREFDDSADKHKLIPFISSVELKAIERTRREILEFCEQKKLFGKPKTLKDITNFINSLSKE